MLHSISVVAEKPDTVSSPTADEKVDQLLSEYNPELQDQQTSVTVRGENDEEIPVHFYGRYRFSDSQNRSEIVSAVSDALTNHDGVNWFTMYAHDCDHDSPDPNHSCSLSKVDSSGTTPEAVKLV